jgi:hypothetical protein
MLKLENKIMVLGIKINLKTSKAFKNYNYWTNNKKTLKVIMILL